MTIHCTQCQKERLIHILEMDNDECLMPSPYCLDEDMNCKRCLERNIQWVLEEWTQ